MKSNGKKFLIGGFPTTGMNPSLGGTKNIIPSPLLMPRDMAGDVSFIKPLGMLPLEIIRMPKK